MHARASSRSPSIDDLSDSFTTFDGPASTSREAYSARANGAARAAQASPSGAAAHGSTVRKVRFSPPPEADGGAGTISNAVPPIFRAARPRSAAEAKAPFSSSSPSNRAAIVTPRPRGPAARAGTPSSTSSSTSSAAPGPRVAGGKGARAQRRRSLRDEEERDEEEEGEVAAAHLLALPGDGAGGAAFVLSQRLRDDATMVTNMLHMELKRRLLLDEGAADDYTTLEEIAASDRRGAF